jgi:myosin-crossreactive antigen
MCSFSQITYDQKTTYLLGINNQVKNIEKIKTDSILLFMPFVKQYLMASKQIN